MYTRGAPGSTEGLNLGVSWVGCIPEGPHPTSLPLPHLLCVSFPASVASPACTGMPGGVHFFTALCFFLTCALCLSPLSLPVLPLLSGPMPGKGWSCILDTALAFAGQEASNDGSKHMPDMVLIIRQKFTAQVECAKAAIATETNVSSVSWSDYSVNTDTQDESIADKLSAKDASLWARYKSCLAAGRKFTSYYKAWMTSSANMSMPSGKKKDECLLHIKKCARQAELLEADLAKRKKLDKKKAKQKQNEEKGDASAPVDVDSPGPGPSATRQAAHIGQGGVVGSAKQAAAAFKRGRGKGSRLSSGSIGISSTDSPSNLDLIVLPTSSCSSSFISGIQAHATAAFAHAARVFSPKKGGNEDADADEDEDEEDEDDEDGDEEEGGGEEDEDGDVSLDQQKATSLDDINVDPAYVPFSWFFWLSHGPMGANIEDLQTEAGGDDFDGNRSKSGKGSRQDSRRRTNKSYPSASPSDSIPSASHSAGGKRKARAGGEASGGASRPLPASGLGGGAARTAAQDVEPESDGGLHVLVEQGDHIVSQMNYSNRQAAHERAVAQHLGEIEMLKVKMNTLKDMGMMEEHGAVREELLKLVRQPLPDPPSPYQEPPPRKRPSSSTHGAGSSRGHGGGNGNGSNGEEEDGAEEHDDDDDDGF